MLLILRYLLRCGESVPFMKNIQYLTLHSGVRDISYSRDVFSSVDQPNWSLGRGTYLFNVQNFTFTIQMTWDYDKKMHAFYVLTRCDTVTTKVCILCFYRIWHYDNKMHAFYLLPRCDTVTTKCMLLMLLPAVTVWHQNACILSEALKGRGSLWHILQQNIILFRLAKIIIISIIIYNWS